MTGLYNITKRNIKLFFKDKGMFFTAMITPMILLVLYATFLANVYRDSFKSALPKGFPTADNLIDGVVGGQLVSALLAVCCITVSFCSNMLMVQDKISGARRDIGCTPVKGSTLAVGYYAATFASTLIICLLATAAGLVYLRVVGWYLNLTDILLILLDVFMLTMFGTALSSIINIFLSSQGQISAVGTIVSACYGFICGAYMPISSFPDGLQRALSFLPGTYGTSLLKNHLLRGSFEQMSADGFPSEVVESIKDSIDCNLYFFDQKVSQDTMLVIIASSVAVLVVVYIAISCVLNKRVSKK